MPWTPEDWEGLLEPESKATHREAPQQALAEILQRIPDRRAMTAADFGCASRGALSLLATYFGCVVAVAQAESTLATAREACPEDNVRYTRSDLFDLSGLAQSIDVALALEVPRLLGGRPMDDLVEQLHACLVEGGILLLSVPAAKRMGGPVELHLGKHPNRGEQRCYHEVELQYRMRRAGFQGLRIRRFEANDEGAGTLLCMAVRRTIN